MGNGVKVLLLASGGIDSTALLNLYVSKKEDLECIHFQYGQPSAKSEKDSIEKIAEYYDVKLKTIILPLPMYRKKYEFLSRNALFVLIASSLGVIPSRISLGIHSGSHYYDSTINFLKDCQQLLDGYFYGAVRIEAPFIEFDKKDIIEYSKINEVPLNLTYSCLTKDFPPCGECPSCIDRRYLLTNER
jgi:7-cyano-7-deazaguanine synthase